MQKQIKILLTLLTALILAISCSSNTGPNNKNTNTNGTGTGGSGDTGTGKRGQYQLITDDSILKLDWNNQSKKDYFETNWFNTFTNQTLIANNEAKNRRTTDEKATYFEDNNTVLGKFVYATNIVWKGTNWIGALYEDTNKTFMQWMLLHVDADGKLMMATAEGKEPPTEEVWRSNTNVLHNATIENFKK